MQQGADVLYDYLDTYARYVCQLGDVDADCLGQMVVPPIAEQLHVLQGLFDVHTRVHDTMGLDGVFLKLLLMHDQAAVERLVSNLVVYQAVLESIQDIVRYSAHIPLEPTQLGM